MNVNDVFKILAPVGICLGIGIGAMGSFLLLEKHAKCLVIGNIQSLTGLEERLVMQ